MNVSVDTMRVCADISMEDWLELRRNAKRKKVGFRAYLAEELAMVAQQGSEGRRRPISGGGGKRGRGKDEGDDTLEEVSHDVEEDVSNGVYSED